MSGIKSGTLTIVDCYFGLPYNAGFPVNWRVRVDGTYEVRCRQCGEQVYDHALVLRNHAVTVTVDSARWVDSDTDTVVHECTRESWWSSAMGRHA